MKKAVLIGIFSLLVYSPLRCASAQTPGDASAVKPVETSSGSTTGASNIQDPRSQAEPGVATAKNQTLTSPLTESAEEISTLPPRAPSGAQRIYDSGVAYYNAGKLDPAINAFKEANRLRPNDPQTQYMLGMVYWKAQAFDASVDSFKRAVRLKPDWAEAHFRLGLTYYVLGRKAQTNESYKKLLELNSPLADKLQRVNTEGGSTNNAQKSKISPPSLTKSTERAVVSNSVAVSTLTENRRPATREPNASSTIAIPSNQPTSEGRRPSETSSPLITDTKNAPTTAISPDLSTATAMLPGIRAAKSEAPASEKVVSTDASALTDIYKVGVGDILDIRLLNSMANRSTLYTVIEGGLIDLPIAGGPVSVAGQTTKDIQANLTAELKRLGVEDRASGCGGCEALLSHTVILSGLVGIPGTKILRREAIPLYVLLAEAQPRADAAGAMVMRTGAPTQTVDLTDSAGLGFLVRSGDVINLTARPQEFYYIGGRVNHPGQKTFQSGITLVQAILAAGGPAQGNVIEISRANSDGRLTTFKFIVKEIKSGKAQDPKLLPGDRIEVLH